MAWIIRTSSSLPCRGSRARSVDSGTFIEKQMDAGRQLHLHLLIFMAPSLESRCCLNQKPSS